MWEPSDRYPDPAVQVLDASFNRYRLPLASVERLFTGCRWSEGPVYFGDGRYVLWSDIPNDRILKWEEETGAVSVFRKSSNNANGNTRDRQGRLVTCEHRGRRVIRTEYDGAITVLADSYQGKQLNSPNDVVVKSDGSIWFTDPPFGLLGYYEGEKYEPELPANVYRVDGQTGAVTVVADDVQGPNGLAFSPDESKLYVVESRAHADAQAAGVRRERQHARRQQDVPRCRSRHAGRVPCRYRRQSLVRLGHGRGGSRRRAHLQSRRGTDRPHRAAGTLRQSLLRRTLAQPAVHGGEPRALCAVCEHAGRVRAARRAHVRSARTRHNGPHRDTRPAAPPT